MRKLKAKPNEVRDAAIKKVEAMRMLGPLAVPKGSAKTKNKLGVTPSSAARDMRALEEAIQEGAIDTLTPRQFVALFCWVHEAIYGVSCMDEVRTEWNVCALRVKGFLAKEFDGDVRGLYDYVTWVSKREESRELYRRQNQNENTYRLQWRHLFLRLTNLTDYRLHLAKTKGVQ